MARRTPTVNGDKSEWGKILNLWLKHIAGFNGELGYGDEGQGDWHAEFSGLNFHDDFPDGMEEGFTFIHTENNKIYRKVANDAGDEGPDNSWKILLEASDTTNQGLWEYTDQSNGHIKNIPPGFVGIGISPERKLHVMDDDNHEIALFESENQTNAQIIVNNTEIKSRNGNKGGDSQVAFATELDKKWVIGNAAYLDNGDTRTDYFIIRTGDDSFDNDGQNRVIITQQGYVGIGDGHIPNHRLDVDGNANVTQTTITQDIRIHGPDPANLKTLISTNDQGDGIWQHFNEAIVPGDSGTIIWEGPNVLDIDVNSLFDKIKSTAPIQIDRTVDEEITIWHDDDNGNKHLPENGTPNQIVINTEPGEGTWATLQGDGDGDITVDFGGGNVTINHTDGPGFEHLPGGGNPAADEILAADGNGTGAWTPIEDLEKDPTVPTHVKNISQGDINNWNGKIDDGINIGTGEEVLKDEDKSGNTLRFRRIQGAGTVTVSQDGDSLRITGANSPDTTRFYIDSENPTKDPTLVTESSTVSFEGVRGIQTNHNPDGGSGDATVIIGLPEGSGTNNYLVWNGSDWVPGSGGGGGGGAFTLDPGSNIQINGGTSNVVVNPGDTVTISATGGGGSGDGWGSDSFTATPDNGMLINGGTSQVVVDANDNVTFGLPNGGSNGNILVWDGSEWSPQAPAASEDYDWKSALNNPTGTGYTSPDQIPLSIADYIYTNGRVGIGVTQPLNTLHVNGGSGVANDFSTRLSGGGLIVNGATNVTSANDAQLRGIMIPSSAGASTGLLAEVQEALGNEAVAGGLFNGDPSVLGNRRSLGALGGQYPSGPNLDLSGDIYGVFGWADSSTGYAGLFDGDVKISGTAYVALSQVVTSDERLKTNITPLTGALDKIKQISGVSFNWKDSSKDQSTQLGVIAQNIEQVYPELVKEHNNTKTVNYQGLVAPLIEAIKEQQAQIEALQREVAELKQR